MSTVKNEISRERLRVFDQQHPIGNQKHFPSESQIQRMRWKAIFFLDNHSTHGATKEIYGFKSKRSAPHVNALNEFEDNMLATVQKIEFRNNYHPNILQQKLAADVKEIGRDKHIFVKADKTTNHYITEPNAFLTLVHKNVTKACKKTHQNVPSLSN